MSYDMPKCRITVLKRMLNQDLADEYLDDTGEFGLCDRFSEGQEFITEHPFVMPEGFCHGAWADIRAHIVAVAAGANPPWIKQRGTIIAGCTDFFKPVVFKVERIE
jgi:uncharacterized repeat protein (TIGR04076 family)